MKFCSNCGSLLEIAQIEQRQRHYCSRCNQVHYLQPKVGAGACIEQDNRLLLIQRTQEPFQYSWNLPAGYVEIEESPSQAAVREVYEEVGLQVEVENLTGVYFFNDDPRGNGILIVYRCKVIGGKLIESEEGINPTFFGSQEIPDELSGGGHNQAITAWRQFHLTGVC